MSIIAGRVWGKSKKIRVLYFVEYDVYTKMWNFTTSFVYVSYLCTLFIQNNEVVCTLFVAALSPFVFLCHGSTFVRHPGDARVV